MGAYRTAWHEPDQTANAPETYFTKYLIDVIEQGVPGQPEGLSLRVIFDRTADALARDRRPEPTRSVRDNADRFIFTRNAAVLPPAPVKSPTPRRLELRSPSSGTAIETATGTDGPPKPPRSARRDTDRLISTRKPVPHAQAAVDTEAMRQIWPELLHRIGERSTPTLVLLQHATVKAVEANTLVLAMPTPGLARQLGQETRTEIIKATLRELVAGEWQVHCVTATAPTPTGSLAEPANARPHQVTEPSPAAASTVSSVRRVQATMDSEGVRQIWPELLRQVGERDKPTIVLLQHATVKAVEANTLVLAMPTPGLARQLGQETRTEIIKATLRELVPGEWQVRCIRDDTVLPPANPADIRAE